jgi:hypothetical protein
MEMDMKSNSPSSLVHAFPLRLLVAAALGCCLLAGSAMGQLTSSSLEGTVVDSLGNPIAGANIIVTGESIQGNRAGITDQHGHFTIIPLPPGKETVLVQHVAYQDVRVKDVSTYLGKTTNLGDIRLRQRTHEIGEVIVSGDKSLLDQTSTTLGANLSSGEIQNLPVQRNYRSIATLVPRANVSYLGDDVSIAGATGIENKYFVDGVDVTDPSFSKAGTNLPYNFVKEVQVMTGGYEAEYRSVLGGLVNVITYSGSNEVHGSAFGFFTNNSLTASHQGNLIDASQGAFSNYDMGFGIGGPIVRDQLWFYAAYNPTFNQTDVDIPDFGTYRDKTVTHSFAGKLTWRASQQLNLIFSSTGDPTVRKAVGDIPPLAGTPTKLENPDPYLTDQTGGGINLSLSGSYAFGERLVLDASLSRVARDQTLEGSTDLGKRDTVFSDEITKTWSGGSFGHLSFFRSNTTARTSATLLMGSHLLKGGIEYRSNIQNVDIDQPLMYKSYGEIVEFLANGTHGRVDNRIYSGFIQDSWHIADGFQINLGLRLDGQSVFGGNGEEMFKVRGLLQPRVGFVFQPDQARRHRIFGSFGRFMQEWSTAMLTIYTGTQYWYDIRWHGNPRLGNATELPGSVRSYTPIPPLTTIAGQHYDEVNLGYEAIIGETVKLTAQGTYRSLREAIVGAPGIPTGNPGEGLLSEFPRTKRNYSALELTIQKHGTGRFGFLASYVLSRNSGTYEGLYDSYNSNPVPNVRLGYKYPDEFRGVTGPLPNDRTHVFKFSGSYCFDFGLAVGTAFTWQTGTPLSEMADLGVLLQPIGSVGRTPNIWDLNARLAYSIPTSLASQTRLILDVFHIASQRDPVNYDQKHYGLVDEDGNVVPASLNSSYGMPTAYQPPMSVRLGIEVYY